MTDPSVKRARITSIDLLRGLVMIIMALDHTRDFFHLDAWTRDPLDPETTSLALFFTRWITHFCAPVFVFLAGASGYLQRARKSSSELSLFLITRGLWLIMIEIVVINFAFSFDPGYHIIGLQTIWSIGISMIILGLLCWLPVYILLPIGLIIVFGHNLLNFYEFKTEHFTVWYALLHRPGVYPLDESHSIFVFYPFLSWTGLMITGYCFGILFRKFEGIKRKKLFVRLGITITLFFIILRYLNVYGGPGLWTKEDSFMRTVFSFLNTQKYPPSLLYMCMTIGPAIVLLGLWDKARGKLVDVISVYGRVPFFYYILHFFLIHLLSMIAFLTRGHSFAEGINKDPMLPNFIRPGEGYPLWTVYLVWAIIVISLFPLCSWYDKNKRSHPERKWLSYL